MNSTVEPIACSSINVRHLPFFPDVLAKQDKCASEDQADPIKWQRVVKRLNAQKHEQGNQKLTDHKHFFVIEMFRKQLEAKREHRK